jgi:Neutral/alkaline non-lysosomal ceramidase, N-terminal
MRNLLVVLILAGGLHAGDLSVGFAETDVTPKIDPDKPVYIAGFGHNRKATKVHDPIVARAVVLSDGKQKIALVCVDVVGLFNSVAESVRKQVEGFAYVCVSSTHNHEGPDTLGLWGKSPFVSGIDKEYMKILEAGIVKAIRDADKTLKPATAKIGILAAPELLHDGREPYVKHEELVAIRFEGSDGKPVGVVVQWNCHPETMDSKNTELTADYVATTVSELKKSQGCPVAYYTGTVGGLMTSLHVPLKNSKGEDLSAITWDRNEEFGRQVARVADRAIKEAKPVTLTPFDVRRKQVHLPVANELYKIGWRVGVLERTFYVWEKDPYPATPVETKDLTKPGAIRTEIGYLKLGELEVAVIPGEIYPELVLGKVQDPVDPGADFPDAPIEPSIYGQMAGKYKMLIGLGNDEVGYILPKRQWDAKPPYCYGRKKDQYGEENSVGPDTGPILCAAFKELVQGKK